METGSTEVTSIWHRHDIEKSMQRTHRYFVDFESRIHAEILTLNRRHNFHVDSSLKINVISTNFPRGISAWNFHVESMPNWRRCVHWVMFRSDLRKKGVCCKSATKMLYQNKFLVSECIFKLACHCESCRLSEIGCV